MVSAYSKPLNLWVMAMEFRLVIDFESGKCQASGMQTIWFSYIKRHKWINTTVGPTKPTTYASMHTSRTPGRFKMYIPELTGNVTSEWVGCWSYIHLEVPLPKQLNLEWEQLIPLTLCFSKLYFFFSHTASSSTKRDY